MPLDFSRVNVSDLPDQSPAAGGVIDFSGVDLSTLPDQSAPGPELRVAPETTTWEKVSRYFADPEKEAADSVMALVDAEAFDITPSAARRNRFAIEEGLKVNPVMAMKKSSVLDRVGQAWQEGNKTTYGAARATEILSRKGVSAEALAEIDLIAEGMPKAEDRFIPQSRLEDIVMAGARQLPLMMKTVEKGGTTGLAAAAGVMALGTAAKLPPNVTSPLAMQAFTVGMTYEGYKYMSDTEAGNLMLEIRGDKNGRRVDPGIAWAMARIYGYFSGLVEMAQFENIAKLFPGGKRAFQRTVGEVLRDEATRRSILGIVATKGREGASVVAENTAQEMVQESAAIVSTRLAKALTNEFEDAGIPQEEWGDEVARVLAAGEEAFKATLALGGGEVLTGITADTIAARKAIKADGMTAGELREVARMAEAPAESEIPQIEITDTLLEDLVSGKITPEELLSGEGGEIKFQLPGFYSALERGVKNAKQKSAPAKDWKAIVRKLPGVKAEEIEWSGLEEWLDAQEGQIPRVSVLEFLKGNGVQVQEVVKGALTDDATLPTATINTDDGVYTLKLEDEDGLFVWRGEDGEDSGVSGDSVSDAKEAAEAVWGGQTWNLQFDDELRVRATEYEDYQLPGGENYRELLLLLPIKRDAENAVVGLPENASIVESDGEYKVVQNDAQGNYWHDITNWANSREAALRLLERNQAIKAKHKEKERAFISPHFTELNILAHIRFNERTDAEGKRVLFAEEIQSDWGQKGRRYGFGSREDIDSGRATTGAVINGPFITDTKAWSALAMKRMIRWAAENGFDRVAWTTGEQQSDRYDLSKQVEGIEWSISSEPGKFHVGAIPVGDAAPSNDLTRNNITIDDVEDFVGKDIAEQIEQSAGSGETTGVIRGEKLKVGGGGMKGFYDKILPSVSNKIGKKYGVKTKIIDLGGDVGPVHSIEITAKLSDAAMEGMPLFRVGEDAGAQQVGARNIELAFPGATVTERERPAAPLDSDDGGGVTWDVELPNGSNITVMGDMTIRVNPETAQRAYGERYRGQKTARGAFKPLGRDGIMWLSKEAGQGTVDHEAFHAAFEMVLTDRERRAILKEFGDEEAAAEHYAGWTPKARKGDPVTKAEAIWRKILDFFARLRQQLMPTAEKTLEDIRSGEVFRREQTQRASGAGGVAFSLAEEMFNDDPKVVLIRGIIDAGGLNKAALLRNYDADTVKKLSQVWPGLVKEHGSVTVNDAAADAGFSDADEMVNDLLAFNKEEAMAGAEETALRMQGEEFGVKDIAGVEVSALKAVVKAAQQARREGKKEGVAQEKARMKSILERARDRQRAKIEGIMTEKERIKRRRERIRALRDEMGLTDADLRKITRKDIRLMSDWEFKQFADDIYGKALELTAKQEAKAQVLWTIYDKRLQKVDNYRKAVMGLPPIDRMTVEELREFDAALQDFQTGDVFLTERELETVDRTDLEGIRTWREAKERLAAEVGVSVEELETIKVSEWDDYRHDAALAERNPFYKMMVETLSAKMLEAEARSLEIEDKAHRLARAAAESRGLTLKEKLIPTDPQIFEYLEAPDDAKQALARQMTKEQIEYAGFIQEYFAQALEYLIQTRALSKGRENYMTHIRRSFLEAASEDGLWAAIKGLIDQQKQDEAVFGILNEDTENILPLEKFFQFSLRRTGELTPSKNITAVFLAYARTFEKKRAFDEIIPKLDIYAQSLTPRQYTPRGLEIDRSMKKFVNKFVNTKKGRFINYGGKQGGGIDIVVRLLRSFTTMLDLGLNIPVSISVTVGEKVANFAAIGLPGYKIARKRRKTSRGKAILEKYKNFIGRSVWEEVLAPDLEITDRLARGLLGAFHAASVSANKDFLLASITEDELAAGEISSERLAEIRTTMNRWRVVTGARSIVGSTAIGGALVQYKTWAVAPLRTIAGDVRKILKGFRSKKLGDVISSREFAEIRRVIGMGFFVMTMAGVFGDDERDKSFIAQTRRKVMRELNTLFQSIDPALWASTPRLISFMNQFGKNLHMLLTLEEYKTRPGELKGVTGMKKQFTPAAVKQVIRATENNGGKRK